MSEDDRIEVADFVYRYNTIDVALIEKEVPAVKGKSSKDIVDILQEDYEKLNREIEIGYGYEEEYSQFAYEDGCLQSHV